MPTIQQTLKSSTQIPLLDTELLLAHSIKKERTFVKAHPEKKLGLFEYFKFKYFLSKRKKGIPFAYITGTQEFYGREFKVNKNTLIPRPETEMFIDLIKDQKADCIIDIGTGSGTIGVTLAKEINASNTKIFGSDVSKKALKTAKNNAKILKTNIEFIQGSLLTPYLEKKCIQDSESLVIAANLPYITEKQFESENSIQKEPKLALVAEDSGLALYIQLLGQMKGLQNKKIQTYFEIDPNQTKRLKKEILKVFPNAKIKIHKDLCGLDRIVEFSK